MEKIRRNIVTVLLAGLCAGLISSNVSWSAITGTAHDLSITGGGGPTNIRALSEDEICVFCHTPHGSLSERPLWNHSLSNALYTVPTTTDLPSLLTTIQQPDKGSRLCLSCHDGTVAIGLLINMPGPGSVGSVAMQNVAPGGEMPPAAYGFVGTDLSGTHPVSIAVNDQLITDKNACNTGNTFLLRYPPGSNGVKLRPTDNTYKGSPGRAVTTGTGFIYNEGMQCTTCHDAHDNTNGDFLVAGAPGNAAPICDTCHYQLCP